MAIISLFPGGGGIDPSNSNPLVAAETANAGTSLDYARADHVHPLPAAMTTGDIDTIWNQVFGGGS